MKRHKPIKKWHVAFTSKKLIDTTGNQLNCDMWHLKKKKKITQLLLLMDDPYGRGGNWWCIKNVCLASSKKGRPWEGTGEIGHEKYARPQLPRLSFLKGRTSILDPPSMIHTRPQLHRPSSIKDGWAYWTFNKHAPRPKHKGQTIIFWSEASTNPYKTPVQIK